MNTINCLYEHKYNGIDDIKQIRQYFYKKKITVSYEPMAPGDDYRRVIFSCSKTIKSKKNLSEIQMECNGLILGTNGKKWKLLVLPITTPKVNINTRKVNRFLKLGAYDIYSIQDGTVINLYYFNDMWIIATSRGYEMNGRSFNNKSYMKILEEILTGYNNSLDQFYDALDKQCCYTFIIRHPDLQPFNAGDGKMFTVQFVNLTNEDELDVVRNNDVLNLNQQEEINFDVKKVHELFVKKESAYDNFINNGEVNFGYLLVSNDYSMTQEHSQIMLESNLMRHIRNLWYDGHYNKFAESRGFNRRNLILLNSYLDSSRSEIFLNLFPQYKNRFLEFDNKLNKLGCLIFDRIHNEHPPEEDNKVVDYFYGEVQSITSYKYEKEIDYLDAIIDLIHSSKYIDLYYAYLL